MTTFPWRSGLARCNDRCDVTPSHHIPAGEPIAVIGPYIACRRCAVALPTIHHALTGATR